MTRSWTGIPELKQSYATLGPRKFWLTMTGTLAYILIFASLQIWLESKIGWPERYGFRCHGRGCWMDDLWHSPALLRDGGTYQLALFAVIWSLPVFVAVAVAVIKIRQRLQAQTLSVSSFESRPE